MKDGDKKILMEMHDRMKIKISAREEFSAAEIKAMITGLEAVVDAAWNSDEDDHSVESLLGISEDDLGKLFTKLNKFKHA